MAAVFVGVAVAKFRASRHPHAQGFVEVDQVWAPKHSILLIFFVDNLERTRMTTLAFWQFQTIAAPVTPEERHVANMQVNGYENPTYKYFEVKE